MSERKGDWMCTYTGVHFWPLDPLPEEVDIRDIGHALSNICRYNGHVRSFYSVAEHSVLVSRQVRNRYGGHPEAARQALLHDAAEAYVGDMIRPLKLCLRDYKVAEDLVHEAVMACFDLPVKFWPIVKRADRDLLTAEAHALMPARSVVHWNLERPLDPEIKIRALPPERARRLFMKEFALLWSGKVAAV